MPDADSDVLKQIRGANLLTIRCAACKAKLWKYEKIGKGAVLRCHKSRITRLYFSEKRRTKSGVNAGKPSELTKAITSK